MKKIILVIALTGCAFILGFLAKSTFCSNETKCTDPSTCEARDVHDDKKHPVAENTLGAFSVSLSVKDLQASKEFYEKLGFEEFGGGMEMNYLIMKNGSTLIGLFKGMFEGNILTFNPGWDSNAKNLDSFDDVRVIQKRLKKGGIKLDAEADETTEGPASFMFTDPDSNVILFDQHR